MPDHCGVWLVPVSSNLLIDVILTQLLIPLHELIKNTWLARDIRSDSMPPLSCEPTAIQVEDTNGFLGAMGHGRTGTRARQDFAR